MSGPGPAAAASPEVVAVHPAPAPEVLAAILAAVDEAWPRPRPAADSAAGTVSAWRFSGRWWSKPTALRRDRPWTGG